MVSEENTFLDYRKSPSHFILIWSLLCGEGERGKTHSGFSSFKMLILSDQDATLMISFNLNYFLTPNIGTLVVRASMYEFWRDSYSGHHTNT